MTATGNGWPAAEAQRKLSAVTGDPMGALAHDREQDAIASAQAGAEGITLAGQVEFKGRTFTFGKVDSLAPMLDFAEAAESGLDTDDPAGLAALKSMIRDSFVRVPSCGVCEACVKEDYPACGQLDEGDWPRFWRLAKAARASGEELMRVVQAAMEFQSARPTPAPSASPSPAGTSSPKSRASSPLPGGRLPADFAAALEREDMIDVGEVIRDAPR